jgi:serine/threonine-protein kinase Chk2
LQKPENILLEGDKVKLTDFGFSRVVGEAEMMKTLCGTPLYLAPEVLALSMGVRDVTFEAAAGYGKAVDMWSLGVIFYMLLSGRPPWNDSDFGTLCETVLAGKYNFPVARWDGVSVSAKALCSRLLTVNPELRITVEEALEHEWVTGESDVRDDDMIMQSPPRKKLNKEFAVPSSKKKAKVNSVLRLINEYEEKSPDLAFGTPCSSSHGRSTSQETTPLLPPLTKDDMFDFVNKDQEDVDSPVVHKKLAFETPEKRKTNFLD